MQIGSLSHPSDPAWCKQDPSVPKKRMNTHDSKDNYGNKRSMWIDVV